jgi:hypothetical protein
MMLRTFIKSMHMFIKYESSALATKRWDIFFMDLYIGSF